MSRENAAVVAAIEPPVLQEAAQRGLPPWVNESGWSPSWTTCMKQIVKAVYPMFSGRSKREIARVPLSLVPKESIAEPRSTELQLDSLDHLAPVPAHANHGHSDHQPELFRLPIGR